MFDLLVGQSHGVMLYVVLFLALVVCGVGNPIPEDVILITGGYLAFARLTLFWPTLCVVYGGVLAGDLLLYYFGRRYGQQIIMHKRLHRIIPPERVDRIRHNFRRRGHWAVFFARFLVGLRSPTFLVSGVMHVPFRRFLLLDGLGALISVPLFVGLGFLFGGNIDVLRHDMKRFEHWSMAAGVVLVAAYLIYLWWRSRKEEKDQDIFPS